MWSHLRPADIEEAKRQLDRRRNETLRKHAAEMERLAADQAAIVALHDMVSAFAEKFKGSPSRAVATPVASAPPAALPATQLEAIINRAAPVQSPITVQPAATIKPHDHRLPHRHHADKSAKTIRHPDRRGHRTNFETYVHAMVKHERGW